MKNITVSVDDELYRKARVRAAEEGTTVSAVFRGFITHYASGEQPTVGEVIEAILEARRKRGAPPLRAADSPSRNELHDRDALH